MHEWLLSDPSYESDQINPSLKTAYWEGHRDFAYDLLNFVRPNKLVELGSQYGCSLFSFCQSAKDFKIPVQINAVDFWSGDVGAVDDGEIVFQKVNNIVTKCFSHLDIHLYQMAFDNALSFFEDDSIDILHIDGGHEYADVDHDFNTWLPKLKANGIILFHDVYSHIDEGSCKHWEYVCKNYSTHFDFTHSCGLGVLFPKGDYWYKALEEANFFKYYKDLYYYRSRFKYTQFRFDELCDLYEKRYVAIQEQSQMIKERDEANSAQAKLLEERFDAIQNQSQMIRERDETIAAQQKLLEERYNAIQEQSQMINERDGVSAAQAKLLEERYDAIQKQSEMIKERDEANFAQAKLLEERFDAIQNQSQMIRERDETIAAQQKLLEERYNAIQEQSQMIKQRDKASAAQAKLLEERYDAIQEQSEMIRERDEANSAQAKLLEQRFHAIQEQSQMILERDNTITQLQCHLTEAIEENQSIEKTLANCKDVIHQLENKNADLEKKFSQLLKFVNGNWYIKQRWNKQKTREDKS